MPVATRVWRVTAGDQLEELKRASLNLESRLEKWLAQDIGILSTDLLVIGQQVETTFGGVVDLLCLDRQGDVVIVELKRDKTPRQITAQILDYACWVNPVVAKSRRRNASLRGGLQRIRVMQQLLLDGWGNAHGQGQAPLRSRDAASSLE